MFVHCPTEDQNAACELLNRVHILQTIGAATFVAAVVHNTIDVPTESPQAEIEMYRRHPQVTMWEPEIVFLINYGMILNEFAIREKLWSSTAQGHNVQAELEHHLDLATTDTYKMERPHFWGRPAFHQAHLNFLATMWPGIYGGLVRHGAITWDTAGLLGHHW